MLQVGITAARVRYLNDQADIKASEYARSALRGLQHYFLDAQITLLWEHAALRRLHLAACALRAHVGFDAAVRYSQAAQSSL